MDSGTVPESSRSFYSALCSIRSLGFYLHKSVSKSGILYSALIPIGEKKKEIIIKKLTTLCYEHDSPYQI